MEASAERERSYPCPVCGTGSGASGCEGCGRGPSPLLSTLNRLDDRIAVTVDESRRLRDRLRTVDGQLRLLHRRRADVAAELTAQRRAAVAALAEAAVETVEPPTTMPVALTAPVPVVATAPAASEPPPAEPSRTRTPEASARSVQNVLLSLGGILSAAAIIVFTAVAWATFGAWGRAGILTVITIALMLAPLWIVRKGLHATAETVSGLAILMVPCDAVALYLLRLFPTAATEPVVEEPATREFGGTFATALTTGIHTPGIAVGLLTITGVALAYRMFTRMIVPGFTVAVLGVVTLAIGVVQVSTVVSTGVLLSAAALQVLAAWLFGNHPARRGRTAGKILVHGCGGLAVALLLTATLVLVGRTASGYLLLAVVVVAVSALALVGRLPGTWRLGPLWTVRIALGFTGLVAIGAGLGVVVRWLLLPLPPWDAAMTVPTWPTDENYPFGWRLTVAIVVLTVAAAAQLPRRDRPMRTTTAGITGPGRPDAGSEAVGADNAAGGLGRSAATTAGAAEPGTVASGSPRTGAATLGAAERGPGRTASTADTVAIPTAAAEAAGPGRAASATDAAEPGTTADAAGPIWPGTTVSAASGTAQPGAAAADGTAAQPGFAADDTRPTDFLSLPRWQTRQLVLALVGGGFAALTLPAALGLSWRGGALLMLAVAVATAIAAVAVADRRLSTALLVATVPLSLDAIVLSVGGDTTMFTVLSALCAALTLLAAAAGWRGRVAHSGGMAGAAVWLLCATLPIALRLLDLAPVHIAAFTGITAAALTLAAGYLATRRAPARRHRFTSWVLLGTVGGIATGTVTAEILAVTTAGPILTQFAALIGLVLTTVVVAMLLSRLRLRPRPSEPQVSSPQQLRRQATGLATITLLLALGAYLSVWSTPDTLPGFAILALVTALIARVSPPRWGAGPQWGSWTVAGVVGLTYAAGAVAIVPALFLPVDPYQWLNWRGPVVLAVLALASLALLPARWRVGVAAGFATLSLLAAPAIWQLPWWFAPVLYAAIAVGYAVWTLWTPSARALTTTWGRGLLAYGFAALGLATAALGLRVPAPASGYGLAAGLAAALVVACAAIAVYGYRRRRTIGGLAVATALVLLPGSVTLAGLALRLPGDSVQLGAMAAACLGLLIAAGLRLGAPGYLSWATLVVPSVAVACARAGLPSQQSGMYVAVAGLVGVGAAMLMLPNRRAALVRTLLSGLAIVATLVKVLPLPLATLALPYRWIGAVWGGTPSTTVAGLVPGGAAPRFLFEATGAELGILAVCVTTIALAVLGLAGRGWGIGAALGALALALPTVPVVFDLPWPTLPFTALVIAVVAYLSSTHVKLPTPQLSVLGVVAAVCGGTAMAGSLASRPTTLTALTVFSVATLAAGLLGASTSRRVVGWLLSAATVPGLITAMAFAAELPPRHLPYGIVAVAALFLSLASARTPLTGPATWAAEAAGHLVAVAAVIASILVAASPAATVSTVAIVLVIYGALLGLLAVRADPDEDTERLLASKPWYTAVSITAAFAAYWLLLADARVSVIEVYTVPFALATLLGGWLELRRRPRLRSWTAYGPGLCLLLLPPLAQILLTEDEPLRRLGLGVASIAILLLGSRQRFQAPVVVATIMLIVQTGYEITLLWTLVPSWLPLAIGGVGLLVLGATFERRRRDVRRLRGALAEMR